MSNKIKDITMKNHTFSMILSLQKIWVQIILKQMKNILIYYIGYVTIKDSKYIKINSVNPLYLSIYKVNRYFEEINGNKHLTLVPTNENKEKI